jgi:hypothetical protein
MLQPFRHLQPSQMAAGIQSNDDISIQIYLKKCWFSGPAQIFILFANRTDAIHAVRAALALDQL